MEGVLKEHYISNVRLHKENGLSMWKKCSLDLQILRKTKDTEHLDLILSI